MPSFFFIAVLVNNIKHTIKQYYIIQQNSKINSGQKGGERMDTLQRLHQLLDERGWSEYRLAKNCGLSNSTIANIYHRNTVPSITTLEAICAGFGITLSQFFAEGEMVELTPELKELFDSWVDLTLPQKAAILQTMKAMHHN
jgi:transcriptional regulator with XRE-family HTH domain